MSHRGRFALLAMVLLLASWSRPAAAPAAAGTPDDAAPPPLLANASFDEGARGGPAAWEVVEGTSDGTTGQKSEVAVDREFVREGKGSLRLSGSAGTTSWQIVRQRAAVTPGQRVTFRVAAKCAGVRKEGKQVAVAGAMLDFRDASDERVDIWWSPALAGTADWTELRHARLVPEKVASVLVCFFLSQSGTVWFDDARLAVLPGTIADPAGRAAAFDAIEEHLRATYPFFGLGRRPKADALFATWRERVLGVADEESFFRALRAMLGDLDDLHVWLRRGKTVSATATATAVRPNVNLAARRLALTRVLDDQPPFVVGRIGAGADAVGYLEITTWQMDAATAARLDAHLEALSDCRALVLDVRSNAGGDAATAERVASRFAAADVVWARAAVRDPAAALGYDAFLPPVDLVLPARKDAPPDTRPVAVLQGRWCMSTSESFLLMARALPNVTTVGERSRGACGAPKSFVVVPDLTLFSSTRRLLPPGGGAGGGAAGDAGAGASAGETIEGRGVPPDVDVPEVRGSETDPVLAKALEILRK